MEISPTVCKTSSVTPLCARATHGNFALYALENFSLTLLIKLKKLKALPFLPVHGPFSKRIVSTLDGALV